MTKPNAQTSRPGWVASLTAATVCLLAATAGAADGQGELSREAKQAVRRLAAIRAMVSFVESRDLFEIPEDVLITEIQSHLPKHRLNESAASLAVLEELASRRLSEHADVEAGKVDPTDELGIRGWLHEKLGESLPGRKETLEALARQRIRDDMKKPGGALRGVYQVARRKAAAAQVRKALERLAKDIDRIAPSAKDVIRAAGSTVGYDIVAKETFDRLKDGKLGVLLTEAEETLRKQADSLVRDGVAQYNDQAKALQVTNAESFTPNGIYQELTEAVAKRVAQLRQDPHEGRKIYGPFHEHGDKKAREAADHKFDVKLQAFVAATKPERPEALSDPRMRSEIRNAPGAHEKAEESLGLFMETFKGDLRARIASAYEAEARQGNKPKDTSVRLGTLRADVANALEAARKFTLSFEAWTNLCGQAKLELSEAHEKVRASIAQEQARTCCPDLIPGPWRMDASVLRQAPQGRLARDALQRLLGGDTTPEKDKPLLEETWELLLASAEKWLAVRRKAQAGQESCVDSLKDRIRTAVGESQHPDENAWGKQYAKEATDLWRSRSAGTLEGSTYPDLLDSVALRLGGIIRDALGAEVEEAQMQLVLLHRKEVLGAIDAKTAAGVEAAFDPFFEQYCGLVRADWRKRMSLAEARPELHEKVKLKISYIVREAIDAQHKSLASPGTKPPVTPPIAKPTPPPTYREPAVKPGPRRTPRRREPIDSGGGGRRSQPLPSTPWDHLDPDRLPPDRKVEPSERTRPVDEDKSNRREKVPTEVPGGGSNVPVWVLVTSVSLSWLIAIVVLTILVAIYKARQRRKLAAYEMSFERLLYRFGTAINAAAWIAQLELAQKFLADYEPDRPVETLADLRQCGRGLLTMIEAAWRRRPDSRQMPDLAIEVRQMVIGGVLMVAMMSDYTAAEPEFVAGSVRA